MSKKHEFFYRLIIVLLTVILVLTLLQSPRSTQAASIAAGAQMLGVTVLDVPCPALFDITAKFTKLGDLGTFTVNSADSLLELTFIGRIYVTSFSEITRYVNFELRVDGVDSTIGSARATLLKAETGGIGKTVTIIGYFSGLEAGHHTASMWVRTSEWLASSALINPNCWGDDVLIVKEHLPFGVSFLPMITK